MDGRMKEAEFAQVRMPFTHTGRKAILQTRVHHCLLGTGKNQVPLLDFFRMRSPGGGQEGRIATQATVAPTCHPSPHSCTPSGSPVLRATVVPVQGPSSLLRVAWQNAGGREDSTESLADAMREGRAFFCRGHSEGTQGLGLLPVRSPGWLLGTWHCLGGPGAQAAATSFPGRGGTYLAERESL